MKFLISGGPSMRHGTCFEKKPKKQETLTSRDQFSDTRLANLQHGLVENRLFQSRKPFPAPLSTISGSHVGMASWPCIRVGSHLNCFDRHSVFRHWINWLFIRVVFSSYSDDESFLLCYVIRCFWNSRRRLEAASLLGQVASLSIRRMIVTRRRN